jgi:hypothetical protein
MDSFEEKWQVGVGRQHFETLRREHPIFEGHAPVASWQPVIDGKLASVSVAKGLFEQKDGMYFLAGVRVTNKTDREIGVDLRSRRYCVRINQWSAIDTAERGIINERRLVRPAFSEEE